MVMVMMSVFLVMMIEKMNSEMQHDSKCDWFETNQCVKVFGNPENSRGKMY